MSNIQKSENNGLTTVQAAMSQPKIRDTENIRGRLAEIYRTALMTCGHKNYDINDVNMQITILEKALRSTYAGVTMEELAYASEKGAIGEYGEFHGISPATFIFWLKGYIDSFERKEAVRSKIKALPVSEPVKIEVTKDEKLKTWNEAKAKFLKTGEMMGEVYLYKIGRELGFIDQSDEMFIEEVKFHAHKRIEQNRENLSKAAISIADKWEVKSLDYLLEKLNAEEPIVNGTEKYKRICKRIAVEIKFKEQ